MRCLLVLLFVSSAAYADDWKPVDKTMLGTALTLLAVDWGQTRDMVRRPNYIGNCPTCIDPYYERNGLLGKDPSIGDVDKYFTAAMLGTIGISYVLPQRYRRWFLGGVIVLEVYQVYDNHRIGLRAEF